MADVRVGDLIITVPGLSAEAGAWVAAEVAKELGRRALPAIRRGDLVVDVRVPESLPRGALALRIVDAIARAISR